MMHLRQWIALAALLLVSGGWALLGRAQDVTDTASPITLFVTGSELGALKPCGCSGGQLGGLDRRRGLLDQVSPEHRLILDTGRFVPGTGRQDLIKLQILMQAYSLMGYDVLHVNGTDQEAASLSGVFDQGGGVHMITSQPMDAVSESRFQKTFQLGERSVTVQVVALAGQAWQAGNTAWDRTDGGADHLTVVLVDGTGLEDPQSLAWNDLDVDCVIIPLDGDEPLVLSEPGHRPLVFSPGRFGRYLVRVHVIPDSQTGGYRFQYAQHPVSEDLPKDPELIGLYRMYQEIVRGERLLEGHLKVPLPGTLEYISSAECQECHEQEFGIWHTKGHAHALATLEAVGSDHDPECVLCHVVGLDYDTGFISGEETPELRDVGCEVCHGPGSEHARTEGKLKMPEPKWDCLKCHTPEHSGGFAGHEEEYQEKIRHWQEPKTADSVKD
jgi:hypothetical protein